MFCFTGDRVNVDVKTLISSWEKQGRLLRVKEPVSRDLEITEIYARVFERKGPALLFEQVRGSEIPLLINMFGTWERIWDIFGVSSEAALLDRMKIIFEMASPVEGFLEKAKAAWKLKDLAGIMPRAVKRGACQQQMFQGSEIDLEMLPVMKCWPDDAGRFVTLPVVVTKDPETGKQNFGMYRMQLIDKAATAMHWHPPKGGALHYQKAKALGQRLEAACVIGCEPAVIYAATAPLPPDMSELLLAGLLLDRPVEYVKCRTIDLDIPANSQIVLEGWVDPDESFVEGPFGDHTGYYTPERPFPVFHITAVTTDSNPVYTSTAVGWPPLEDALIGKLTARIFLPFIKFLIPEIKAMEVPEAGVFHNFIFVAIDKRYPGHAYKVMDSLWGLGQMSATKIIVVFDGEVNVHDHQEVLFHLGSNVEPLRDVMIRKGPLDILDHASLEEGFGGKMGIDATSKCREEGHTRPWPKRAVMDEETKHRIDGIWTKLGL